MHSEKTVILGDSRDYRKIADGAMRIPEKGIPGLFPEVTVALGSVHQCRMGVL
jgi:hypothetical protein